jgi:hypothetical protein
MLVNQLTNRTALPDLFTAVIVLRIFKEAGKTYGPGWFIKKRDLHRTSWINTIPNGAHTKLNKLNKNGKKVCLHCGMECDKNSIEHIIAESKNTWPDEKLYCGAACGPKCNSSKYNYDYLNWWILRKMRNIREANEGVINIYVRGKYRLLKEQNRLDEPIPQSLDIAITQVMSEAKENGWGDYFNKVFEWNR